MGRRVLFRFLLRQKFRRAVGPIGPHLVGASALTVCGGSGMDAEYFARMGAQVTSSDLSQGAAIRAKVRSERYDLGHAVDRGGCGASAVRGPIG